MNAILITPMGTSGHAPRVAVTTLGGGTRAMPDRRRYSRVTFRVALPGMIGRTQVYVIDASVGGIGVAHEGGLPPPGEICRLELMSEVGPIKLDCAVIRTESDNLRLIFYTGLSVIASDHQSASRLQRIAET